MKKERKTQKKKTILSIIAILITAIGIIISTEYVRRTEINTNNNHTINDIRISNISNQNEQKNIRAYEANQENIAIKNSEKSLSNKEVRIENIPEYSGQIVIDINNNIPYFKEDEITTNEFEIYSELDELNRAQVAFANISKFTMPPKDTKRSSLSYKPSGWVQYLYGENNNKHLYERSHLIAWQLGNENNNKKNLITGTTQLNSAMIEYENIIADWIKQKGKENKNYHVLYRVTPIYQGENKLATGVELEAKSVEEEGISFNKFIYNVHDDFEIDYATGTAKLKE